MADQPQHLPLDTDAQETQEWMEALDGVISDNDLKRSMKEIEEARQALQRHEQALLSKHAAGKERAPQ